MSTSATHSGATTRAGRSGKGLGIAAATLAVVIAAGFVFAVNQGNEASVSDAQTRAAQIADARYDEMVRMNEAAAQAALRPNPNAEIDRLNELAATVKAESHPAFNIEATKMEMARQNNVYPGKNPETRTSLLIDNVPSNVQPVVTQPSDLNQPEWDNRLP